MLSTQEKTEVNRLEHDAGLLLSQVRRIQPMLRLDQTFDDEASALSRSATTMLNEAKGIRLNAFRRLFGLSPITYKQGWWHWWLISPVMLALLVGLPLGALVNGVMAGDWKLVAYWAGGMGLMFGLPLAITLWARRDES